MTVHQWLDARNDVIIIIRRMTYLSTDFPIVMYTWLFDLKARLNVWPCDWPNARAVQEEAHAAAAATTSYDARVYWYEYNAAKHSISHHTYTVIAETELCPPTRAIFRSYTDRKITIFISRQAGGSGWKQNTGTAATADIDFRLKRQTSTTIKLTNRDKQELLKSKLWDVHC